MQRTRQQRHSHYTGFVLPSIAILVSLCFKKHWNSVGHDYILFGVGTQSAVFISTSYYFLGLIIIFLLALLQVVK